MLDLFSATALGALVAFNAFGYKRLSEKTAASREIYSTRATARTATRFKSVASQVGEDQAFIEDPDTFFGFEGKANEGAEDRGPEARLEAAIAQKARGTTEKVSERLAEQNASEEAGFDEGGTAEKINSLEADVEEMAEALVEVKKELEELRFEAAQLKRHCEPEKHAKKPKEGCESAFEARLSAIEAQVAGLGRLAAKQISEIEGLKSRKAFKPEELAIVPAESVKKGRVRVPDALKELKRRKDALEAQLARLKFRYVKRAISKRDFEKAWNEKQRLLAKVGAEAARLIEKRSPRRG